MYIIKRNILTKSDFSHKKIVETLLNCVGVESEIIDKKTVFVKLNMNNIILFQEYSLLFSSLGK